MNVRELLAVLAHRDVKVSVNGDKLHVDAPPGAVTDDLRAVMTTHKADLIRLLAPTAECCSVAVGQQGIVEQYSDDPAAKGAPGPIAVNEGLDPRADPRPDLLADHARWTTLLRMAYEVDGQEPQGVFGALYGIRCCGASIVTEPLARNLASEGPAPRWRLERGEIDAEEWARLRSEWLVPHTAALTRLLAGPK